MEEILGTGSYGIVIKAKHKERYYAVKALFNRNDPAELNVLPFKLEAEILSRIAHPQIPALVDAFTLEGIHYIVQEFVEGLPLSSYVDSGHRFKESEVKELTMQLLSILKTLHCPRQVENALVHRDLRLSNLLLKGNRLYLIDFGLARFIDPSQFAFCPDPPKSGTKEWSQKKPGAATYYLLRREISPRSDLFGVGVVAIDLFTPWVQDETLFSRPWEQVLPLSGPFITFLQRLLSRDKGFQTAGEAMEYLMSLS